MSAVLNHFENILLGNCAYRLNTSIDARVTGTIGSKAWAKEQRSVVQENVFW